MNQHSIRLALLASAVATAGAAAAMPAAAPAEADPCVVYPYYGQIGTPVPGVAPSTRASAVPVEADPAFVYPYYGETSTPVPAAREATSETVVDEWGVVETAEDLERVLAAYRRGQYLGL